MIGWTSHLHYEEIFHFHFLPSDNIFNLFMLLCIVLCYLHPLFHELIICLALLYFSFPFFLNLDVKWALYVGQLSTHFLLFSSFSHFVFMLFLNLVLNYAALYFSLGIISFLNSVSHSIHKPLYFVLTSLPLILPFLLLNFNHSVVLLNSAVVSVPL